MTDKIPVCVCKCGASVVNAPAWLLGAVTFCCRACGVKPFERPSNVTPGRATWGGVRGERRTPEDAAKERVARSTVRRRRVQLDE